jgi:hypothetical protein
MASIKFILVRMIAFVQLFLFPTLTCLSHQSHHRDNQYRKLCEYKQLHGHCHVPRPYPEDPKVRTIFLQTASIGLLIISLSSYAFQSSNWVFNQRSEYSRKQRGLKNSLNAEREAKLDAINFRWSILGNHKKKFSKKNTKIPSESHAESKFITAVNPILQHAQYYHGNLTFSLYKQQQQQAAAIAHQDQLIVSELLKLKG